MKTKAILNLSNFIILIMIKFASACLSPPPPSEKGPDLSLFLKWTVNGREPDDMVIKSLSSNSLNVEIWEDSDCDSNFDDGFYIYRFNAKSGICINPDNLHHGTTCSNDEDCGGLPGYCMKFAGKTVPAFFRGVNTCIKVVLISGESNSQETPSPIAEVNNFGSLCNGWYKNTFLYSNLEDCSLDCFCYLNTSEGGSESICTVADGASFTGCLDLGTVDFDLPYHGPLDLNIEWENPDGTFGTCSSAGVLYMGYKLERRVIKDGNVTYEEIDSMNVEGKNDCRGSLNWPLLPFEDITDEGRAGFYRVEIKGRNFDSSIVWQSNCTDENGGDLKVDSREEGSNTYTCKVSKL